jgi:hypothetical protein
MRRTIILATTTAVIAIVAGWGATIVAHSSKRSQPVAASTSLDVMKMMKDAKNLPEERFDAH